MTKATDAGFVEGKFYAITGGQVSCGNNIGDILKFDSDDNTSNPYFQNANGDTVIAYLTSLDNTPREGFSDKVVKDTPAKKRGFVVGEKYMVKDGDDVRGFGDGALVEFVRDDGTEVPLFKSMLTKNTRYMTLDDIVNINGRELKEPEPVKTPAEAAGLKVGDKVVVTEECGGHKEGEVMTLETDDGSTLPYFTTSTGRRTAYYLSMVEKFDEDKPQITNVDGKMVVTLHSAAAKAKFNAAFDIVQAYRITGNSNYHCFEIGDVVYIAENGLVTTNKGMTKTKGNKVKDESGWVREGDYVAI